MLSTEGSVTIGTFEGQNNFLAAVLTFTRRFQLPEDVQTLDRICGLNV